MANCYSLWAPPRVVQESGIGQGANEGHQRIFFRGADGDAVCEQWIKRRAFYNHSIAVMLNHDAEETIASHPGAFRRPPFALTSSVFLYAVCVQFKEK